MSISVTFNTVKSEMIKSKRAVMKIKGCKEKEES
jgi:hypothetical protein